MNISIRVDSGQHIGTGHVMRCLTLADQMRSQGHSVLFLCKEHPLNIIHLIEQRGYNVASLSSPQLDVSTDHKTWLGTSQEEDATECINAIKNVDTLIVDHYALDEKWEKKMRPHVGRIFVIDDLADRDHDCDILLDQNYYTDMHNRYEGLIPKNCKTFFGPQYALLKPEYYEYATKYEFRDTVKNVLVYYGGMDVGGMTLRTLRILEGMHDLNVHVVVSKASPDFNEISMLAEKSPQIKIFEYVDNMAQLMASCDVAFGAGGATQWERLCIGVPSFVVAVAENQRRICEDVSLEGAIFYGGMFSEFSNEDMCSQINSLIQNKFLRHSIHLQSKTLMKQSRKDYITPYLENLENLHVRYARYDDCRNIYQWRYAPEVMTMSNNKDKTTYEDHEKWFRKTLENPYRFLFVAEKPNSESVGIVRFDIQEEYALVSIYLVPGYEGKGLGGHVLRVAENYLKQEQPNHPPLRAEVLRDNVASHKMFARAGYSLEKSVYTKS